MKFKRILLPVLLVVFIAAATVIWGGGKNKSNENLPATDVAVLVEAEAESEETLDALPEIGAEPLPKKSEVVEEAVKDPEFSVSYEIEKSPQTAEIPENTCTISIKCDTILQNMDMLNPDKTSIIPADGTILAETAAEFEPGESVFDVTLQMAMDNGIHMEFEDTPMYDSMYIEGIANLYEFDCGDLSGWIYKVNGKAPKLGCSKYILQNGDTVEWIYTCDLGRDV